LPRDQGSHPDNSGHNVLVAGMNRYSVYEAQRLLRRANEISPESAALAIKAMQSLCEAHIISRDALYYVYQAFEENADRSNIIPFKGELSCRL
jgi:hypothetical protein